MVSYTYLHIISRIVLYCMLGIILALQIETVKTTQKMEMRMSEFEDLVAINFYLDKRTEDNLFELRDAHNAMGVYWKNTFKTMKKTALPRPHRESPRAGLRGPAGDEPKYPRPMSVVECTNRSTV